MCDDKDYNVFPPQIIGGPTGKYFVQCPVTSARWVEYALIAISNGGNDVTIIISGDSPTGQLPYDGSKTLSDDAVMSGIAIAVLANTALPLDADSWFRVTHSQKRVFIDIQCAANTSCYVSLRFRAKLITIVPGPAHTIHPDAAEQLLQERADKTKERLQKMGIPERVIEHG